MSRTPPITDPLDTTTDEVLTLLAIVAKDQWVIDKTGRIRNEANECPICALVNCFLDSWYTENAFAAMAELVDRTRMTSLSHASYPLSRAVRDIMQAADNKYSKRRARLMFTLGMM